MRIRVVIAGIIAIMLIPAIAVALIPDLAVAGDVIFISNKNSQVTVLSKHEVQYIFLGQKREWQDGKKIVFAIQKDNAAHENFLDGYIGKNSFQFSNYWKKQVFTGKCAPPRSFQNDLEMINFVRETSGAIGYVSSGADLADVNTVSVQ